MHWPDRKVVEAPADVGQHRLALGWGGWAIFAQFSLIWTQRLAHQTHPLPPITDLDDPSALRYALARGSSTCVAARTPRCAFCRVVRVAAPGAGAHRSTRHRLSACSVGQTDAVGDTGSGAEVTAGSAHTDPDPAGWLLLVYRIPSEPTRLRATVWRRLKSLGAVYLQNSAAALPATDGAERALRRLRREILEMNGSAVSAVLLGTGRRAGHGGAVSGRQGRRV